MLGGYMIPDSCRQVVRQRLSSSINAVEAIQATEGAPARASSKSISSSRQNRIKSVGGGNIKLPRFRDILNQQ